MKNQAFLWLEKIPMCLIWYKTEDLQSGLSGKDLLLDLDSEEQTLRGVYHEGPHRDMSQRSS